MMVSENDLLKILSTPTKKVIERATETIFDEAKEKATSLYNPVELDAPEPKYSPAPPPPAPIEEEEPYNAEDEAEKRVNFMVAISELILKPIAVFGKVKGIGGKKELAKMKAAYLKKIKGETLEEKELKQIEGFEQYKKDMQLLNGKISFSQETIERLTTLCLPLAKEKKIKTNAEAAFYTAFLMEVGNKGLEIYMD